MAFHDLEDSRQYGAMGGATRISYEAISTWARDHKVTGEAFDHLKVIIQALDQEWLKNFAEQQKQASTKGEKDGE